MCMQQLKLALSLTKVTQAKANPLGGSYMGEKNNLKQQKASPSSIYHTHILKNKEKTIQGQGC